MKFTLINYDNESDQREMSVNEILEDINDPDSRSDNWTNYDKTDWMEGLLEFTQWTFILPKGFKMFWNDPGNGECSGEVVVSHNILVKTVEEIITTDKGEIPFHELKLISSNRVKVKILVQVETTITARGNEDVTKRLADIYLHDEGEQGHVNKIDLGGTSTITILED